METIKTYEALVKLDLDDAERALLSGRAEKLLQSFGALADVDTTGVEPLVTVLDIHSVMRDDAASRFITRDELLANAPDSRDGYFQVPKTLD